MYWINPFSDLEQATSKIQRANLDGSNIEDLVTAGQDFVAGLALDMTAGKMYWASFGGEGEAARIQRANLAGSQVEELIDTGQAKATSIALDGAAGKMYWAEISGSVDEGEISRVRRASLDGSQIEDLVNSVEGRMEIALDVAAGKIYWTNTIIDSDYGGGTGKIQRANLDGSQIEDLVTSGLILGGPIALDLTGAATSPSPPTTDDCVENLGSLTSTIERTGSWTTDCPSTSIPSAYARFFTFTLDRESGVDIGLRPNPPEQAGDTRRLNLLHGAGREGNPVYESIADNIGCCPSLTILDLAAGTYTVEAINENVGPNEGYDLTITPSETEGEPITNDCVEDLGTLTAATSRTGEWISDCASVTKAGNYARFYSFALGQEAEVTIDLESSQDTVLNLLEGSGTSGSVIANNDDVESGNTNSRVSRTLAAGTYTVEATTFGPATTGSFTLNIALSEGTGTPEPPPISGGCVEDLGTLTATREVGGSWASDCVSTNEPNTYARFYSFTLGQEAEVQIDLTSSEDTVLYLRGPVAGGVLFNDDVGKRQHQLPHSGHPVRGYVHRGGLHLLGGADRQLRPEHRPVG